MANAMLSSGEHVDQEAADEFSSCQRHGSLAARPFGAVILDAEGDMIGVCPD
jgi:hypothetical protein